MSESEITNTTQPKRRIALWGGLFIIVASIATAAIAHTVSEHMGPFAMMHGEFNVQKASEHIKKMVDKTLEGVDATDDQKIRVNDILQAAFKDLIPEHQQIHDAHAQLTQLLSQPAIDRAAIEAIRASQIVQLDTASQRLMLAIEDASEVLTPEQRQKLIAMRQHHMAMHHMSN